MKNSQIGEGALKRLLTSSPASTDIGLLLLRLWFGLVLAFGHGLGKMGDLAGFTASVASRGFPLPGILGPGAAFSELLGGLLLALGLFTRISALPVIGTMLGAAFVAHAADPFSRKEFALCYASAALVLLVAGPGRFSLDARIARSRG